MTIEAMCEALATTFANFQTNTWEHLFSAKDIQLALGEIDGDLEEDLKKSRVQKALYSLVKRKLDEDPKFNRLFKAKSDLKWFDTLLSAARLKELTQVKIVVKGRKGGAGYNIGELISCFYGKKIIASLKDKDGNPFNVKRRRVVSKAEFEVIKAAFLKIKLKLPETIEPTKTELFFKEEDDEMSTP